jgi:hypothetical protein
MKVNCLGCGFKVDLASAYDDYEGQIKCFACGKIMQIATQEGNVRAVRFALPASDFAIVEVTTQEADDLRALQAATMQEPVPASEVAASASRIRVGRSTRAGRSTLAG